jgi:uncharacterized repeat protein (TIGR01451 family)
MEQYLKINKLFLKKGGHMNKKGTISIFVALFAVAVLLLSSFAQARTTIMDTDSGVKIKPNGEFIISVFKDGEWQDAGKLSFNQFFRQREIDLSRSVSVDEVIRVRLVQSGGGAAHIDSVLLGGLPAHEIKGAKEADALDRISRNNYDVIEVFSKSIELSFPATERNRVLNLTARVESTEIGKTPFQFPLVNLHKKMDEEATFYTYRLNSSKEDPKADLRDAKPFFKKYSRTGSGHPSGYTYGWVRNDDKNLYVTIDFTPDNTMDGEKDYAKVYAKTKAGLKEFRVSVPEEKWGRPLFTYTDKVEYQHKLYEFIIPLKETGIENYEEEHELLLAFAAYGTAVPAPSLCGNGTVDPGEECDDGNNTSNDGCSADCKTEEILNNFLTFIPMPATFASTPDASGCPPGFAGTFSFEAVATNTGTSDLEGLFVEVVTLTGGNLLKNADGGPGGEGALMTVSIPPINDYSDRVLSRDESTNVHLEVCLASFSGFSFFVNMQGVEVIECPCFTPNGDPGSIDYLAQVLPDAVCTDDLPDGLELAGTRDGSGQQDKVWFSYAYFQNPPVPANECGLNDAENSINNEQTGIIDREVTACIRTALESEMFYMNFCPPRADLSIVKTDNADPVVAGNTLSYTVVVNNAGPNTAENVVVTDTLPAGVTFVSTTGCTNDPNGVPICNLGNIPAGGSEQFAIEVTVDQGTSGTITNTASVTSDTNDPDGSNNSTTENTTVNQPRADLSITKSDNADPVLPGTFLTYTVVVNNAGPQTAENVVVADTLPAGVTFVQTSGCNNDPNGVPTCNLGNIPAGGSAQYTIDVSIDAGTSGTITNEVSVTSDTTDPAPGNNSTTEDTTVNPSVAVADLSIAKVPFVNAIRPNRPFSYTIAVANAGPNVAANVAFTDTLPAGMFFVSIVGCLNGSAGFPACNLGGIGIGTSKVISLTVTTDESASGPLTNRVAVSFDGIDPNPENNNTDADEVVIVPVADLDITKVASVNTISPNTNISYTITVGNAGPDIATKVIISDTLPAGMTGLSTIGCLNDPVGFPTCNMGDVDVDFPTVMT